MPAHQLDFLHRFVPAPEPGPGVTLLLLHGTGGNEEDLLPLGQRLVPGAALLSPRGKVVENGMPRFFRRFAEGVFDEQDIRYRAHELALFISAAAERYELDPSRIYAAGYSNGANIAAAMLLLEPQVLAGALLLRAMVPLVAEQVPDLHGKPVFLSSGRRDPIAGTDQPLRLAELLAAGGAEVTLNWVEGGHSLESGELAQAHAWFANSLR